MGRGFVDMSVCLEAGGLFPAPVNPHVCGELSVALIKLPRNIGSSQKLQELCSLSYLKYLYVARFISPKHLLVIPFFYVMLTYMDFMGVFLKLLAAILAGYLFGGKYRKKSLFRMAIKIEVERK